MRIYWTLKSIPELAELPKTERMAIWRECYFRGFKDYRQWLALAAVGLCTYFGGMLGQKVGWELVGGVVGAGIGGLVFGQVATRIALPHIRSAVSRRQQVSPDQPAFQQTGPKGG